MPLPAGLPACRQYVFHNSVSGMAEEILQDNPEERLRRYLQIAVAVALRLPALALTEASERATVSAGSEVEPRAPYNSIRS